MARAAEKRGWAWTYWQFDSNFIVYDIDKDAWNEPIYRALVPPARGEDYFLPDRRSISEANFEPFLSIFTRRWRTPVLLGAVVGDLERVGAEDFQRLVESLFVHLGMRIALGARGPGLRDLAAGAAVRSDWRRVPRPRRLVATLSRRRLAEARRHLAVDVLFDVLRHVVFEQLEDAAVWTRRSTAASAPALP